MQLADSAGFEWDRGCIFGPYTPDDRVVVITGLPGAASRAYDTRSNDAIDVLMFIRSEKVVYSIEHARGQGDFGPEIVGKCYSKTQAVFVVRIPPSGRWGNIGPP